MTIVVTSTVAWAWEGLGEFATCQALQRSLQVAWAPSWGAEGLVGWCLAFPVGRMAWAPEPGRWEQVCEPVLGELQVISGQLCMWLSPEGSGPTLSSLAGVATEIQTPLRPEVHLCRTALYSRIPRKQPWPVHPVLQLHWVSPVTHSLHASRQFLLRFLFSRSLFRNY